MLCYFKLLMDLFKGCCEICNAHHAMCELCYLNRSNHANLLLLNLFSTKTFIVSQVTGCHVVIIV